MKTLNGNTIRCIIGSLAIGLLLGACSPSPSTSGSTAPSAGPSTADESGSLITDSTPCVDVTSAEESLAGTDVDPEVFQADLDEYLGIDPGAPSAAAVNPMITQFNLSCGFHPDWTSQQARADARTKVG